MDLDVINQETSKLKPLSSELDSSLPSASVTGRDQSSSGTLRHRHPPFIHPSQRRSSGNSLSSYSSLPSTFPETQASMEPSHSQAPPTAPPFSTLGKESVFSPTHMSSLDPSLTPQIGYHSRYGQSTYQTLDDEGTPEEEDEMDLDETNYTKASRESRGQPQLGDPSKCPPQKNFVYKLFQMMEDIDASTYIHWSNDGREFIVTNQELFAKDVLSKHFKHSNFSSFVRQLNMYDFHKTNRAPRSQRGVTQQQNWIFIHPNFQKGRPDLLARIKRKAAEMAATLIANGEDQLQIDRRGSFSGGIRSPPNGLAGSQDAIAELQRENAEIRQRLAHMERAYKELNAKLNNVLEVLQSGGRTRPSVNLKESGARSFMPINNTFQHGTQEERITEYDYNVPSTLGTLGSFQQPAAGGLNSPATDSQSSVAHFPPTEQRAPFASPLSRTQTSSSLDAAVLNTSSPTSLLNATSPSMTGIGTSYQTGLHQSDTVSSQHYMFGGIGGFNNFNLNAGSQFPQSQPGQNFAPSYASAIPVATNQGRTVLGGRANPVARTPAKGVSLMAVPPKVQPPDSTGGLRR